MFLEIKNSTITRLVIDNILANQHQISNVYELVRECSEITEIKSLKN